MVTKSQMEDVAGDYERAQRLVDQAAGILDDISSLAVEITGQFGHTSSRYLIDAAENLSCDLDSALSAITHAMKRSEPAT